MWDVGYPQLTDNGTGLLGLPNEERHRIVSEQTRLAWRRIEAGLSTVQQAAALLGISTSAMRHRLEKEGLRVRKLPMKVRLRAIHGDVVDEALRLYAAGNGGPWVDNELGLTMDTTGRWARSCGIARDCRRGNATQPVRRRKSAAMRRLRDVGPW